MITIHDDIDKTVKNKKKESRPEPKIHSWRLCPAGKHFVKEHIVHTKPSKEHPEGTTKKIHDHCAINPSKKDILTFDEIQIITKKYFPHLSGPPKTGVLKGYAGADKFDAEIRGWVRYWNDIFSFPSPLEPDLVKALIASESSFHPEYDIPSGQGDGRARGLMQVTDYTMHILSNLHGELHDHLLHFDHPKLLDPSTNICAGVRWLFRCFVIARSQLGDDTTWVDAAIQYKGKLGITPPPREVEIFLHHYSYFI